MQQSHVETQNLEHVAREVGRRWGAEMKAQYLESARSIGNWPGTLDEARALIDSTLERPIEIEERELLALLVERGARRAWHASDRTATLFG